MYCSISGKEVECILIVLWIKITGIWQVSKHMWFWRMEILWYPGVVHPCSKKKKRERKREEPLVFFGKLFLLAQFFFLSMSHYDVKFTVLRIIEQWCWHSFIYLFINLPVSHSTNIYSFQGMINFSTVLHNLSYSLKMIQSGNKRFYSTMKTHQVKLRFIMQCPFPHNGSINFFSTVEITDYSLKCLKLIESFP